MAKLHTRKKSVKKPQLARQEIPPQLNAVTDYIKRWTNRELVKLQEETAPICIPTSDGYRVGQYRLKVHANKTCDVLDHNLEFIHRFESKISAILYVIYTIKRRYFQADQILNLSLEINKCYTDMLSFRWGVEQARQRKDYVAVDNRQARLEIAENRLNLARDRILKIHRTAKYYKVWE